MLKLKSKLVIAVIIMFSATAFMSCEKEDSVVKKSVDKIVVEKDDLEFISKIEDYKEIPSNIDTKSLNDFANGGITESDLLAELTINEQELYFDVKTDFSLHLELLKQKYGTENLKNIDWEKSIKESGLLDKYQAKYLQLYNRGVNTKCDDQYTHDVAQAGMTLIANLTASVSIGLGCAPCGAALIMVSFGIYHYDMNRASGNYSDCNN